MRIIVADNETQTPDCKLLRVLGSGTGGLPRDPISAVPRALMSCPHTDNKSMDSLSPQELYSTRQRLPGDPPSSPHIVPSQRGQLLADWRAPQVPPALAF